MAQTDYGATLLQSLANLRQEELARQQLEKQNQLNIPAMLAGALTSGGLQEMFQGAGVKSEGARTGFNIPETLRSIDWGKLGTPEALTSALTGAISPNYGGLKDVAAGGVGALQTAKDYEALKVKTTKEQEKEKLDLLSNFDFVPEGTPASFDLNAYSPSYFPKGTFVRRKQPNPLFGMLSSGELGDIGKVENPFITLLRIKGATETEILKAKRELGEIK